MWQCPACGKEIDDTRHIVWRDGVACCAESTEIEDDDPMLHYWSTYPIDDDNDENVAHDALTT